MGNVYTHFGVDLEAFETVVYLTMILDHTKLAERARSMVWSFCCIGV